MVELRRTRAAVAVLAMAIVNQAWAQQTAPVAGGPATIGGGAQAIGHRP